MDTYMDIFLTLKFLYDNKDTIQALSYITWNYKQAYDIVSTYNTNHVLELGGKILDESLKILHSNKWKNEKDFASKVLTKSFKIGVDELYQDLIEADSLQKNIPLVDNVEKLKTISFDHNEAFTSMQNNYYVDANYIDITGGTLVETY